MHVGFLVPRKHQPGAWTWVRVKDSCDHLHTSSCPHVRLGIGDVKRGAFMDWMNAARKLKEMHIPSLICILHFMNLTKGQESTNTVRCRRSTTASSICPSGCATCSPLNGCLSCKPRLFFHLEQDGMRQRGTCLTSCPRGHYGVRLPHLSTCTKCKVDCASCFSENFCTHCHPGFYLFRGKCESSCPNGLTANAALRECTDCPAGCESCVRRNMCTRCRPDMYLLHGQCHLTCPKGFEPDVQLMQCAPQIHCEVGEWTDWGPCVRQKNTRTYRKGEEARTRQVLHSPSVHGNPCPLVSEIRKCAIRKRQNNTL